MWIFGRRRLKWGNMEFIASKALLQCRTEIEKSCTDEIPWNNDKIRGVGTSPVTTNFLSLSCWKHLLYCVNSRLLFPKRFKHFLLYKHSWIVLDSFWKKKTQRIWNHEYLHVISWKRTSNDADTRKIFRTRLPMKS